MHRPFFVSQRVLLMKRYTHSNCAACGFMVMKKVYCFQKNGPVWTGLGRDGPACCRYAGPFLVLVHQKKRRTAYGNSDYR